MLTCLLVVAGCIESPFVKSKTENKSQKNMSYAGLQPRAAGGGRERISELYAAMRTLAPQQKLLPEPEPMSWRAEYEEKGQDFGSYLADGSAKHISARRRTIYLQPIGTPSRNETRLYGILAEFMSAYFLLPVKQLPPLDDRSLPKSAWDRKQLNSDYVMDKILLPKLPKDAAAVMGITSNDLSPGEGWKMTYAFGMTWIYGRVGVMSIARMGDSNSGGADFHQVLRRALKICVHETCHAFSLRHCSRHLCSMNGRNSLQECDRAPLWLCSNCVAKLCYATGADPLMRYRELLKVCEKRMLNREAEHYRKAIELLEGRKRNE